MLTVGFDDVFAALRPAHHEPTVLGVDEDISWPGTLHIVHNLPDRTALLGADLGVLASSDAWPILGSACSTRVSDRHRDRVPSEPPYPPATMATPTVGTAGVAAVPTARVSRAWTENPVARVLASLRPPRLPGREAQSPDPRSNPITSRAALG